MEAYSMRCIASGARPTDLSLRGGRRFAVANRRRFCYNGQEKGAFAMLDVCDPRVIRALLEKYGFHFSKAKGQNFLTQRWVPQRIAQEAGIDRSTRRAGDRPRLRPADAGAVSPCRACDGHRAGHDAPPRAGRDRGRVRQPHHPLCRRHENGPSGPWCRRNSPA